VRAPDEQRTSLEHWRIRPARAADRAFILALAPRLSSGFALPPWRTTAEVTRAEELTLAAALVAPPEGSALLVAEDAGGRPAGFVYLQSLTDYFEQADHAHVSVLAVSAEAEGRGAGRVLLEEAERWAQERGYPFITLNVFEQNVRARGIYERQGYVPETLRYVKPLAGRRS
jgi:ribosomal protein S18 acetylase RimI-like enzyme